MVVSILMSTRANQSVVVISSSLSSDERFIIIQYNSRSVAESSTEVCLVFRGVFLQLFS